MAQEVPATSMRCMDYVMQGDAEVARLRQQLADAEHASDFDSAAGVHARLEEIDGYSIERRIGKLLQGLGFAADAGDRSVASFSGGWRIRLNLARALITPSDLLLLDEPTNHLDLDASLWLQRWLQDYPGTLLMISHDRDFIDATCERILHLSGQKLASYKGNYSQFEQLRAEQLANQQASFKRQQARVAEIEAFVERFRYKASKARQAQSRLKELERMQGLAPAHLDSPFEFHFEPPPRSSDPLVRLDGAMLGYEGQPLLRNVELVLRPGSRYGLLGRNGAGKSTLLKSLVGRVPLLGGEREVGEHCRIGYFDQQQLEVLDLDASPALHLQRLQPEAREQAVLDFLGGFDFRGERATGPIADFSGGEKARLALAMVIWQRPNLLVLDEPTNHLDLEMRQAMAVALQGYQGALIVVSHDRHLLRNTVEELLLVHDGRLEHYPEDLAGYEQWVLSGLAAPGAAPRPEADAAGSRREQRQQAAARREQLRPLRKQIEKTERRLATITQQLDALQARLAEADLYEEARKPELAGVLRDEAALKAEAESLEEQWLTDQESLEELENELSC